MSIFFELVPDVGAAPLFMLPKQTCYCYTTSDMIVTDNSLPSLNDRHYSVPFAVAEYLRSYHPCDIPFRSACLRLSFAGRKSLTCPDCKSSLEH